MNRAYAESQGELIKFFDADDLTSPEMIERQVGRLDESRACVASPEREEVYNNPSVTWLWYENLVQDPEGESKRAGGFERVVRPAQAQRGYHRLPVSPVSVLESHK